jgi:hypothetical protein
LDNAKRCYDLAYGIYLPTLGENHTRTLGVVQLQEDLVEIEKLTAEFIAEKQKEKEDKKIAITHAVESSASASASASALTEAEE